jgi:hypothetical protein
MTRPLNINNGLQDWKTEHQAVTGGIFYCRDSSKLYVSSNCKATNLFNYGEFATIKRQGHS